MMTSKTPASITRKELHDLVWREPRTKLAEIWCISDVAIRRLCVKADIPAPSKGYWAKRAAGGRTSIEPLPMRLPGQSELIEIRSLNEYQRWNAPVDLDTEITPPTYHETVEEIVHAAVARLGPYRAKRDLSDPHHGLLRVLRSEAKREKNLKEHNWSFYKPHFSEPRFQRQLRIFSSIFYILDRIDARCEVDKNETWIQGAGHVHHLTARVAIGSTTIQLQFWEPENPKSSREVPRSSVTTLRVGASDKAGAFADEPSAKIENRLEEIVKAILVQVETRMRSDDFSYYERKIELKRQMLHEIAEQKREEEEMRLAAIQARKEAIRNEIANAAADFRDAEDIRRLVEAMADHPDWVGDGRSKYLAWSKVALAEADAIDPMLQPIDECFSAWKSEVTN